jgi:putative transposase
MTHQEENPVVDHVMTPLIKQVPAAMAPAVSTTMKLAMQSERQQALKAESHRRTDERQGYANGFKPKTIEMRIGDVPLPIPQTRRYHDNQGRPIYPLRTWSGVSLRR